MKKYEVYMDLTISVTVEVEAENKSQAEQLAMDKVDNDNGYWVRKYDSLLEREVTEVHECEDEEDDTDLKKAIRYVRDNMDEDDMVILKAEMNQCYKMHLIPTADVMDCSKVIDLLEEYGEYNDLPEGWWESECEIDEILLKL